MFSPDDITGMISANAATDPLEFAPPSRQQLSAAYEQMIVSASGWRKVFAESGDEEDDTPQIKPVDRLLGAIAALALCEHLGQCSTRTVVVGTDSRPTGALLAELAIRIFVALGVTVRYLSIAAAPQIMADSAQEGGECDAFFYISASHNPIGHNGFKMGRDGGVYDPEEAHALASIFDRLITEDANIIERIQQLSASVNQRRFAAVYDDVTHQRHLSLERYLRFALTTAAQTEDRVAVDLYVQALNENLERRPLGIVGELNGSARGVSIDRMLLTSLGVKLSLYNDRPSQIVHPIVPEGENLDLCRSLLEKHWREDPSYLLGYSVDNDGDRGNLVYIDEFSGTAKILDAQSVFTLAVISEFAQSRITNPDALLATVVNGPTSMRVDRVASLFGATVFRSEVGEANVVSLANQMREEFYTIPILGEGSNGGNITHPAKVRDPLNTLLAIIQLVRSEEVAQLWFTLIGKTIPQNPTLQSIIDSIPPFKTTETFSPLGIMRVISDHRTLKNRYETLFIAGWEEKRSTLESMGFFSYIVYQMEGSLVRTGMGEEGRTAPYTGGYKVALCDKEGREIAFLWMRGSRTEPVFRVMVDLEGGDEQIYDFLLHWHRSLIEAADQQL